MSSSCSYTSSIAFSGLLNRPLTHWIITSSFVFTDPIVIYATLSTRTIIELLEQFLFLRNSFAQCVLTAQISPSTEHISPSSPSTFDRVCKIWRLHTCHRTSRSLVRIITYVYTILSRIDIYLSFPSVFAFPTDQWHSLDVAHTTSENIRDDIKWPKSFVSDSSVRVDSFVNDASRHSSIVSCNDVTRSVSNTADNSSLCIVSFSFKLSMTYRLSDEISSISLYLLRFAVFRNYNGIPPFILVTNSFLIPNKMEKKQNTFSNHRLQFQTSSISFEHYDLR